MQLTFAIPFLDNYSRMARALATSIRRSHPQSNLIALTTAPAGPAVTSTVRDAGFDDLIEYQDPGFDSAGYTAVVWTRLHLWDLPASNPVVCLDADMLMYRALDDDTVSRWRASGTAFGSFLDGNPRLDQHFTARYRPVAAYGQAPAACAAFLILEPQPGVTEELVALASTHNGHLICPEQAILSLHAAMRGGWLDLSAETVTQSWSPSVLHDPPLTPLIHFGSPRPAFFGPSPLRYGDPAWDVALERFHQRTGRPFPVDRFRAEFEANLRGACA